MKQELPPVRAAQPEDYPQIMQLCKELHEENGAAGVDWQKVQQIIIDGINRDAAMIGLIGQVGAIEAIIYLNFSAMWYSEEVFLQELFAYVRPDFRRTKNAKALLRFAKAAAKRLKCRLLIGVISNTRTAAKLRLYERELGNPVGGYFFLKGDDDVRRRAEANEQKHIYA